MDWVPVVSLGGAVEVEGEVQQTKGRVGVVTAGM